MSPTFIRAEVRSPAGLLQVAEYQSAVATMKGRPANNVTSWAYQAAMHATAAAPQPLYNGCQHGSWFFLSWHRMYVYYFERIVRAAVVTNGGPLDWALPYWNYGLNGVNGQLPPAFRDQNLPNGQPNPLYVAQRNPGINAGTPLNTAITSASNALSRPFFEGATQFGGGVSAPIHFWNQAGQLELLPHNAIHNAIGGWMQDPRTAAQDPIFWLHHSNIDRLWAVWQASNEGTTDIAWTGEAFSFFDEAGAQQNLTCAQVVDYVTDLDYDFAPSAGPPHAILERAAAMTGTPPLPGPPREPELVGATDAPLQLRGAAERVTVSIDARAQRRALADKSVARPTTILSIEDIEGVQDPGTIYGIYVNLPDGAPADLEDLHRVGVLSFFGIKLATNPDADQPGHGLRVSIDISDTVDALERRRQWDDSKLSVTLRPLAPLLPGEGPDGDQTREEELAAPPMDDVPPVTIGRISIAQG